MVAEEDPFHQVDLDSAVIRNLLRGPVLVGVGSKGCIRIYNTSDYGYAFK